MTGGVEVTKCRKHGFSFHDLVDLSADEKVTHRYAVCLTDTLVACGSESVRGDGFCESPFR